MSDSPSAQAKATKSVKIHNSSLKINNGPFELVFNLASTTLVKSNIALGGKRLKGTR